MPSPRSPRFRGRSSAVLLAVFALAPTPGRADAAASGADPGPQAAAEGDAAAAPTATERGGRAALAARGLTLEGFLFLDRSTNLAGGVRRGSVLRYPAGLALDADMGQLLGWAGGRLHVGSYAHAGRTGADLVGDVQGFDNLDSVPFRGLLELWWEQALARGRVRVKVGRVDANTEFASAESASPFLHSSAGFSPAIQGFPSFPGPAPSVNVLADPAPWLHVGLGVYRVDSSAEGESGRPAPFVVSEATGRWHVAGRRGRVSLGHWSRDGLFGSAAGVRPRGAAGLYLLIEHALRAGDRREEPGPSLLLQAGWASGQTGPVDQHVGGGLVWPGAIPGRPRDVVGILVSAARSCAEEPLAARSGRETAVELVYDAHLLDRLSLKADLQRISNPGGEGRPAALVGSLRAEVRF